MKHVSLARGSNGRSIRGGRKVLALVAAPLVCLTTIAAVAPSSAGAATKFTGPPIVIGTTQPVNTPDANYPGDVQVADATVDQINAAGGITTADGKTHQLKLIFCNNEATANG